MPLFFWVAGWVYKEKPILLDLKKRIKTIIVPYFSFGILTLIYWQLIERNFRNSNIDFVEAVKGLVLGKYDYLDFNVHLWFLPCFFITVVLFNVFVNLGGKKTAYIFSFLMSVLFLIVTFPGLFWCFDRVFKYIGFYAIGVYLSDYQPCSDLFISNIHKNSWIKAIIAIGLLILNFILSYFNLTTGIMWFVTAIIGLAGVAIISLLINKNKILQYFGQISLVVLCIHGPIYRIIVKIISLPFHINTDTVRENFILSMVIVVITMLICSLVYEIIVRIIPCIIGKNRNSI